MTLDIQSKTIDHLGLVAGMYDELNIGENIDRSIKQNPNCRNLSIGTLCKALVINGLGFVGRTLYMVDTFFDGKPVDSLLGPGVTPSQPNDSVLGRALDEIQGYGITELYAELVPTICRQLGLDPKFSHMDSTDFHLDGRYNSDKPPEADSSVLHLTKGYSRDHRPDLNQVVLNLITDNEAGIVLHMEALSGNTSDKTAFRNTVREHIANLQNVTGPSCLVMDSAGYTAGTISSFTQGQRWISRVPETVTECKRLVQSTAALTPIDDKHSYRVVQSHYGEVEQRWLLVRSEDAYKREMKTLVKNTLSASQKEVKLFEKLCRQAFSCEADAASALVKFEKNCRHIVVNSQEFSRTAHYSGKGRPAKTQSPTGYVYHICGNVSCSLESYKNKERRKGRYVIATNELDEEKLSHLEILTNYKSQAVVEKGFRFLKDPWFVASNFFVKKPERVEALTFLMTLCLTVYAALEHKLRKKLAQANESIPNQVGKESSRPTARWIFSLFTDIHFLYVRQEQPLCLNLKEVHLKILTLLGDPYKKHYLQI